MDKGQVMQIGRPEELYCQPQNQFVAGFIGISNQIRCHIVGNNGTGAALLPDGNQITIDSLQGVGTGVQHLFIRPEDITINPSSHGAPATVLDVAYHGNLVRYRLLSGGHEFRVQAASEPLFQIGDTVRLRIRRATIVPAT
jgi:iron(III) transport system ATP-binding protein